MKIGRIIFLLTLIIFCPFSRLDAAVLYGQSIIDREYNITPCCTGGGGPINAEGDPAFYSVFPFWSGAGLVHPKLGGGRTLTADIRFLRVKRSGGVNCGIPSNILVADDFGNTVSYSNVGGVAQGEYCDFPMTGASAGKKLWSIFICIDGGCGTTDPQEKLVLGGSAQNPGYAVDGLQTNWERGGWAFQVCDAGGCTDFSQPINLKLSFPVGDILGIQDFTPFNYPITAIKDNDQSQANLENGLILAYSGALAACELATPVIYGGNGKCKDGTKDAKSQKGKGDICDFISTTMCERSGIFEYWTPIVDPFPNIDYVGGSYLSYDGHTGYDYGRSMQDPILAADSGVLCIATQIAVKPNNKGIWRDPTNCPFSADSINGGFPDPWSEFHTFYIIHGNGELVTWYLHSDHLESAVFSEIEQFGFAKVIRKQPIAFMGKKGATGTHLHFEVRDGSDKLIDPYGFGGNSLWE